MRIFNDQELIQSLLDGGVHRHLICQWLREQGLPQIAAGAICEREWGIYELEEHPGVAFHIQKATPRRSAAILSVRVGNETWPADEADAIREALDEATLSARSI